MSEEEKLPSVGETDQPRVDPLETNSQYIALAPENYVRPDAKRAEISEDSRFQMINPNRAMSIMSEKMYSDLAQKFLFEGVKPQEQSYSGEHQRGHSWTQYRAGKTESGAEVSVKRGEETYYVVEQKPYYQDEVVEHRDGIEIKVQYGEPGKDARSLHWYLPGRGRGRGEKDVPEHIMIFDAQSDEPLTLTRWNSEMRGPDPRFDCALQEMGTLLSGRITWESPRSDEPPDSESEFALPKSPDQPQDGTGGGLGLETGQQLPSDEGAPQTAPGSSDDFEASVRNDISNLPETTEPHPNY
ncbi:MAG: hypothetical protein ACREGG_00990 [Candidatus Saccharimonadales bacterium]